MSPIRLLLKEYLKTDLPVQHLSRARFHHGGSKLYKSAAPSGVYRIDLYNNIHALKHSSRPASLLPCQHQCASQRSRNIMTRAYKCQQQYKPKNQNTNYSLVKSICRSRGVNWHVKRPFHSTRALCQTDPQFRQMLENLKNSNLKKDSSAETLKAPIVAMGQDLASTHTDSTPLGRKRFILHSHDKAIKASHEADEHDLINKLKEKGFTVEQCDDFNAMMKKLLEANPEFTDAIPANQWKVLLVDTKGEDFQSQAFSNGTILICKAWADKLNGDVQAFELAREMGRVACRHSLERFSHEEFMYYFMLHASVLVQECMGGQEKEKVHAIFDIFKTLKKSVMPPKSTFTLEADQVGLLAIAKADFDPTQIMMLFGEENTLRNKSDRSLFELMDRHDFSPVRVELDKPDSIYDPLMRSEDHKEFFEKNRDRADVEDDAFWRATLSSEMVTSLEEMNSKFSEYRATQPIPLKERGKALERQYPEAMKIKEAIQPHQKKAKKDSDCTIL